MEPVKALTAMDGRNAENAGCSFLSNPAVPTNCLGKFQTLAMEPAIAGFEISTENILGAGLAPRVHKIAGSDFEQERLRSRRSWPEGRRAGCPE